jgi:ATP-dependent Lon protease
MAESLQNPQGAGGKPPMGRDIPTEELPILALKNVVVFPGVVLPIHVSRDRSIAAIEAVLSDKRIIGLLTQKDETIDEPGTGDLYTVGTIGQILKVLKMPEGGVRVLTQGLARYRIQKWTGEEPYFKAIVQPLPEDETDSLQLQAMMRSVQEQFRQYVDVSKSLPKDNLIVANNIKEGGRLADFDGRTRAALAESQRDAHARDPAAADEQQDPEPGARRGGQEPARLLPARADEGYPARVGRERPERAGTAGVQQEDRSGADAGGSGKESARRDAAPGAHAPRKR